MATWTDPAEVIPLQASNTYTALGNLEYPTLIASFNALLQEEISYPAYSYTALVRGLLNEIDVITNAVLTPPPVLTFGLDYNSAPLLFGYPQDPTWVVTLHCTPKALQYWG